MYVYFDSGTTYSRIFLTEGSEILGSDKKEIGSKDTSIAEENLILVEELKNMYDGLLKKHHLMDSDIKDIFASGMVTSPFGIKEVPHVSLPITFQGLKEQIFCYYEPHYFRRNIQLIPGVKNVLPNSVVVKQNFSEVNSTRGEEFEAFGIIEDLARNVQAETIAIILPGSHTQILYIKNGTIYDVLSTISGELFYAIGANTILSSSIIKGRYQVDQEMLRTGFHYLKKFGFNRALYLVNTMKIFSDISNVQKTSYLEGVITGGVIQALQWQLKNKWHILDRVIVADNEHILSIYETLLQEIEPSIRVSKIVADERRSFSARAFLKLIEMGK